MNTSQVAYIVIGANIPVAAGWDLIRRHIAKPGTAARRTLPQDRVPLADIMAPPPHPPMTPLSAPAPDRLSARPADLAQREAWFAEYRAAGKSVAEARGLVGIAERTGRTYEARRLAALNGAAAGTGTGGAS